MKALSYDEQKGPQGIKLGEMPVPDIGANDVLVRIKAFSLNHLDLWVMSSVYPAKIPLPHVFASDASGVVERTGAAVEHIAAGDEVVIYPGLSCGSCIRCQSGRENECDRFSVLGVLTDGVSAEYTRVPAANIFRKPAGLSFEEASGIGITYTTAWNSLVLRSGIRQGETVLVHGAGSGAGTAAVQIARVFNARVIATVGDAWKIARAKELGCDVVIDHRQEDVAVAVKQVTGGRLADIVVDHVGTQTFTTSLACLRRGGRLVTFGATSGDAATISLRHLFGKNITIHGVYVGPRSAMANCLALFPSRLRTVVDSVHFFEDAAQAYEKLLSRRFFGKIVVRV